MKVLLTGAGGQVGRELCDPVPPGVELVALDRAGLDISRRDQVNQVVGHHAPQVIINAAAYTAVDRAESEADAAYAVNAQAAGYLAEAAADHGCRLVHLSTDFVFDGRARRPYRPLDETAPLNVYGASKLAGEQAVMRFAGERALVIRSAWIYSVHGRNFVKTMLRLMGEREELAVVNDQFGSPTWARDLARVVWIAAGGNWHGFYHWTDAGVVSWYEFARAIQALALDLGLLRREIPIRPIAAVDYPVPASRPAFSALDIDQTVRDFGVRPLAWRTALRSMLVDLAQRPDPVS